MKINRTYTLIDVRDVRSLPEMKKFHGCVLRRSEPVEVVKNHNGRDVTDVGVFVETKKGNIDFVSDSDSFEWLLQDIIGWRMYNQPAGFVKKSKALLYLKRMSEYLERTNI